MTASQEPAPDTETETGTEPGTAADDDAAAGQQPRQNTSAEDVESDGPLDADEGDPDLDAYPG